MLDKDMVIKYKDTAFQVSWQRKECFAIKFIKYLEPQRQSKFNLLVRAGDQVYKDPVQWKNEVTDSICLGICLGLVKCEITVVNCNHGKFQST